MFYIDLSSVPDSTQSNKSSIRKLESNNNEITDKSQKVYRGYASAESQWKIEWQSSGKMKCKLMLTLFDAIK